MADELPTPAPLPLLYVEAQIVRSVGEVTDVIDPAYASALASTVPLLLARRAGYATLHPDLPALYAKRDAIEIVQGAVRQFIATSGDGASSALNQVFDHLVTLWQQTQGEIVRITGIGNASRTPRVGRLGAFGASAALNQRRLGWIGTPYGAGMAAYSHDASPFYAWGAAYGSTWLGCGGAAGPLAVDDNVVLPGLPVTSWP